MHINVIYFHKVQIKINWKSWLCLGKTHILLLRAFCMIEWTNPFVVSSTIRITLVTTMLDEIKKQTILLRCVHNFPLFSVFFFFFFFFPFKRPTSAFLFYYGNSIQKTQRMLFIEIVSRSFFSFSLSCYAK